MSKLTFDESEHKYFLGGEEIPGVTRILALAGLSSRFNIDEEAALRGRYVHQACSLLDDEAGLDWETLDDVLVPYVAAYQKFKEQYPHKVIEGEKIVYSDIYRFAGRLDRVIEVNGHLELYDIASGGLDAVKALQTAAYQICFEEITGKKIAKRFGLQLRNNGQPNMIPYNEKTDKGVFLGALGCVNWKLRKGRA